MLTKIIYKFTEIEGKKLNGYLTNIFPSFLVIVYRITEKFFK